jgi:cyclohexadienyl dehydratase
LRWQGPSWLRIALLVAIAWPCGIATGQHGATGPTLAGSILRVGTSGDYAPFSTLTGEDPIEFAGFDIAVARAYAADRGFELRFVRFVWHELSKSLASDRFDLAMSGVTIRPERTVLGRFSITVAETGAMVIGRPKGRFRSVGEFNRPSIRIGVNAGGHLERVATRRFARATVISIPDNAAVRETLIAGNLDAAVTDSLEAPHWLEGTDDLDVQGPFTTDRKAYLVRADRPGLAADLDAWLLEREADGSLRALRLEYFGREVAASFTPLDSLLAAMDERLSLMPLVAVAKRNAGMPLEVPDREQLVLDAAVESARAAAERVGAVAPDAQVVRGLFRAQMEAAKEVQWNAIQDPLYERPDSIPDVKAELRPAILRIGDRIGQLLVSLPAGLSGNTVRAAAAEQLRTDRLSDTSKWAIADAIAAVSAAKSNAEAATRADAANGN